VISLWQFLLTVTTIYEMNCDRCKLTTVVNTKPLSCAMLGASRNLLVCDRWCRHRLVKVLRASRNLLVCDRWCRHRLVKVLRASRNLLVCDRWCWYRLVKVLRASRNVLVCDKQCWYRVALDLSYTVWLVPAETLLPDVIPDVIPDPYLPLECICTDGFIPETNCGEL